MGNQTVYCWVCSLGCFFLFRLVSQKGGFMVYQLSISFKPLTLHAFGDLVGTWKFEGQRLSQAIRLKITGGSRSRGGL